MPEPLATTENVLHPRQVEEIRQLRDQKMAMAGGHAVGPGGPSLARVIQSQIQDAESLGKEITHLGKMLDDQAPKPIPDDRLDEAVQLEHDLADSIREGMPSQAEYRRNTAGAVDRHRAWEKAKKSKVLKWKHIRRRMHATGISDFGLDDEADVSNVEKLRPREGMADLADAQIPHTRTIHQSPPGAGQTVIYNDADMKLLRDVDPETAAAIGLLDNDSRGRILAVLRGAQTPKQVQPVNDAGLQSKAPCERCGAMVAKSHMRLHQDKSKKCREAFEKVA